MCKLFLQPKKMNSEKYLLNLVFEELWPLFRSITGDGIEQSLAVLDKYIPLNIEKTTSGSQVFDWTVPPSWNINRGRLWGPDGSLICDTYDSNLHVVSYSEPISKLVEFEELLPHLHSIKHLPDAIPYVTSYYNKTWGFCLKDSVKKQLPKGLYKAEIESNFDNKGGVLFGHNLLKGDSDKEVLLTSYLCHPSLANNELSGPLVLLGLYNRIKLWPKRRFSYRFLLNPETIGSLCFLSRYNKHLQEKMIFGFVLTCMGGPVETLRYKKSKCSNRIVTNAIEENNLRRNNWVMEEFSPINGSEERQYCSPGFNLPVGQIARTIPASRDEYHNSLDNKEFMDIEQIINSIDQLEELLLLLEVSGKPVNLSPFGEPQLGKRNLYPNINNHKSREFSNQTTGNRNELNSILTILSMSDGNTYMKDIAEKCNCTVEKLIPIIEKLEKQSLIKFNAEPL